MTLINVIASSVMVMSSAAFAQDKVTVSCKRWEGSAPPHVVFSAKMDLRSGDGWWDSEILYTGAKYGIRGVVRGDITEQNFDFDRLVGFVSGYEPTSGTELRTFVFTLFEEEGEKKGDFYVGGQSIRANCKVQSADD